MGSQFKKEPTEFQREVLALTLQDFRERTNICQLVRQEAFELNRVQLSDEEVDECTQHYYKKLRYVHKWDVCALKDLIFLPNPSQDVQILEQTENEVKYSPLFTNSLWIHT